MNKKLIISFDDLYNGNDRWEDFLSLQKEIPNIKITFFVITSNFTEEFYQKIKQPWCELVYHSYEHSGHWLQWNKEEATKQLLQYQTYGFAKGFKAPGWKITESIQDACSDLDFWICSCKEKPVKTKHWYTDWHSGIQCYQDYDEFYGHIQDDQFNDYMRIIRSHHNTEKPEYKFISEMVHE